MSSLTTILTSLQRGFLKNLLEGAGLALATSGLVLVALKVMIITFQNSVNSLPATLLNLMGLGGFDVFFATILAAVVARHQQKAARLFLTKK
ncbi:DUF2523 domain-containing protein [Acinetobacter beijerinckii]|uniref:DUF2523 family protein n=1 Tax=Acinetobacter beijerinckii TaxID=262668 RepID=UPI0023DDBAB8|nr:DUF2523 family protein [Acinetobacter beijerinckii]MDF2416519.1 DUF2523 domain-containing protein [Acinetobacter beijerinckii]